MCGHAYVSKIIWLLSLNIFPTLVSPSFSSQFKTSEQRDGAFGALYLKNGMILSNSSQQDSDNNEEDGLGEEKEHEQIISYENISK